MQQFLLALQFQQQQAALQQALNYGTQYGFAPGGNWMTWGQGGPTQMAAGTPTLADLASQMGLTQAGLQNALNTAQVTGLFNQPGQSQYAAGTVLTAPSQAGGGPAYGVVNADGSVTMATNQELQQIAGQRGTTAQAMMNAAQPVDWNTLQTLSQGPPIASTQPTLAAQQQQFAQAGATAQLTGQFTNPQMQPAYLLQQGMAMNGQSFYSLPQDQQQYWLQYNENNPTKAAQAWAGDVNNALQQAGYQNPQAAPQQTLASQLQNAQLTGFYNGAPTEQASEFARNLALGQGQLGQQYLSTAAQLQGPQNTFQQSNYLRGAQGNPNVPVYLQSLQNNMNLPSFQATGSTTPTPQSAAGLTSQMGYGVNGSGTPQYDANGNPIPATGSSQSATPGWDYGQTLNTINQIAQRGAPGLAPGSLEKLSPDELQAFGSGLGAAGYSLPSFLQQYQASRVGQQAPVGAMALTGG